MNRRLTNIIRFFLDECLPPIIRDNKYFMYPLLYVWFKGKNIRAIMNFKRNVWKMSHEEFVDFYNQRDSMAKDRPTDLSEQSIDYMLARFDSDADSLLDVGCGNGYWLEKVRASHPNIKLTGCDVFDEKPFEAEDIHYQMGNIEALPFSDNSVDIVSCHHVLEHVIDLKTSIEELRRVARKQVFVVVPKQRYYYYTFDEHVRFFPYKELLEYHMGMDTYHCQEVWGDFVYIGVPASN